MQRPFGQRRGVRAALIAASLALSFVATLLIGYELARARVPEHRARLERLVQSQTGLDVRFNELTLRWGWYGPEAVFRRVELGEPGRSNVLLRAPQLIVGFDAWRTMQTGQLAAGRITLVAPDIDLERFTRAPSAAPIGRIPERSAASRSSRNVNVLERWRGGRIDLQGGTLRVPDPNGSANPIVVNIRRASLRRADGEWNGFCLVYLPERLGRAARVAIQLKGNLQQQESWTGGLRFDGMRLSFAGWRELLANEPAVARVLPSAGAGDVIVNLTLKNGLVTKANGQLKATEVGYRDAQWSPTWSAAGGSAGTLTLGYVAGNWHYVARRDRALVQVEQLVLARDDTPLPRISVEIRPGHVRGTAARVPLFAAAAVARWLAPELLPGDIDLQGSAHNVDVDWNTARPEGGRLAMSAHVEDGALSLSHQLTLSGLHTRIFSSESRVLVDANARSAQLRMEPISDDASPESASVSALVAAVRAQEGWQVNLPHLNVEHDGGQLAMTGTMTAGGTAASPVVDLRGTMTHADVEKLRVLVQPALARALGSAAGRLVAGHLEDGKFEWKGALDRASAAEAFKGSFILKDARIAAEGPWPEASALDARIEWSDGRVRASVDAGRAGVFKLESVAAQWDVTGTRASRVSGRARARLEQALAWVRDHPEVQEYTPHVQDLVARGETIFDFDVAVPPQAASAENAEPPAPRARIVALLEDVEFRLAPELPSVESLRGSLAFDAGRLQRSTLTANWLGGPLTLKLSERRDRRGTAMAVQAQGFVHARRLVALSELRDLPEVMGETPWSGEFVYVAPSAEQPARWLGKADSTLVGIESNLPEPLAKTADSLLPLHVEITGNAAGSKLRVNLADRVRTLFALEPQPDGNWQIARGAVRVGGGVAVLPSQGLVLVTGQLKRFDLPAYVLAWQQLTRATGRSPMKLDIDAAEMAVGNRLQLDANVQATQGPDGAHMRVQSPSLGVLVGTFASVERGIALEGLQWTRDALDGTGSIHCADDLETCKGRFELTSDAPADALADLGFRPELRAEKGSLTGELTWRPRAERPWLETVRGRLSMRFEDGITRTFTSAQGRPFPLLTVPALLIGMTQRPAATSGELRFRSLDAEFDLQEGDALTSNLHFDGDAEILMRGRTGLLAHDYDYEAWVLRGEERIPASLRRLAATPRIAAAWVALRELVNANAPERSRIVLHLRGSWSDPVVTTQ